MVFESACVTVAIAVVVDRLLRWAQPPELIDYDRAII
jgi:hypothetical protein